MECRLEAKIEAMVSELAREHRQELAEAGTLVDLEELTCQIGDEVARQLCQQELVDRGERAMEEMFANCPDCGEPSMRYTAEPALLEGMRGELAFRQPRYYCPGCRRAFFPDGCFVGAAGPSGRDAEGPADDGLGGQQPKRLRGG